jgi:FKBP-type peptidyl-prolyl cis-trans isomerase (trigger factor)
MNNCTNITKTPKPETSEVELTAAIPVEAVAKYRTQALKELGKDAKLAGFRPGHIPENVLVQHIGEAAVMRETANAAIGEEIPLLLATEKIPAIATPQVTITKLAPGNPIEFTALIQVLPTVTLPDYKKIAKKLNAKAIEVTVSDEEVSDTMLHLRRERARIEKIEAGIDPTQAQEEITALKPEDLPELDDAFVKTLGADDAQTFATKLRENIKNEKTMKEREKRRIEIVDEVIKDSKIALPKILVEQETDAIEGRFSQDLSRMGATLEAYLKHSKKSREDLREEWKEAAEKRARMHLALREIADKENIFPNPLDVEGEMGHIQEHHPDANMESAKAYVETTLRIEAVFKWLEEQK